MATSIGFLNAILSLDSRKFHSGFKKAEGRMSSFERSARRTRRIVGAAFAGIGASLSVRKIANIADEFKQLEGRLRLVTSSNNDLIDTQTKLFKVAQATRSEYSGVVELYARLARSSEELGTSQRDLLSVTELVNKAIIVSGASSTEASAALMQLSQGLASGALRGDELRSVLEQTPRLARAIAQGMGESIGQLRRLGTEGKLTTEVVINALLNQSSVIDKEFSKMPITIGQALTKVGNEFGRLVNRVDKTTESSKDLSSAIVDFSEILKDPKTIESITVIATALARVAKFAVKAATGFANFGKHLGRIAAVTTGNIAELEELNLKIKDVDRALNNSFFGLGFGTSTEELQRYKAELEAVRDARLEAFGAVGRQSNTATIDVKADVIAPKIPKIPKTTLESAEKYGQRMFELARQAYPEATKTTEEWAQAQAEASQRMLEGKETAEEYGERMFALAREAYPLATETAQEYGERMAELSMQMKDNDSLARDLGFTFSSAFEDAIVSGNNLRDVMKGLEQDIIRIITRQLVTEPLAKGITGIIGSTFGGGKAMGGPVSANQAYLVGERGPELFMPKQAGDIVPNDKLGNNVSVVNNFAIQAPQGTVSRESQQQVAMQVGLAARRAIQRNS